MRDILHISMEDWEGVWRRNQNVATELAHRFPQHKILYVNLDQDFSYALRTRQWNKVKSIWKNGMRPSRPQKVPESPNIWLFTPLKLFPNTLRLGQYWNKVSLRRQVRWATRLVGLDKPFLYINPYSAAHMPGRMGEWGTVYDVGDDWVAYETTEQRQQAVKRDDDDLTQRADAVVVVSQHLCDLKREIRDDVVLIPNGVDVERYKRVAADASPPHPLTEDWIHPVIGHVGTLDSGRTDVPLLIKVARAFPQRTIALVGPINLSAEDEKDLKAQPNVRLVGAVPHQEVPHIMKAFDVHIVPQQVNSFTDSQNPLKLFESLATGLPTVATPISGFRQYPHLIHLAKDAPQFIHAIQTALHEPGGLREERQREAENHSWKKRVDELVAVYEDIDRKKKLN
ncbi:Glycosyltransferase involved in cell wall bisynthesis [Abditibacterium utsteinense]|uniref:Glycosyltransferase involved in cell wall bisynthesis n=1 Tax=Abditibacterium utsteinense TaxID=1960156 RepID=A0A2S8SSC2_9BACT|nr:glycosyltransferase [Abditibacterium utsteinense]PQV63700.1 Glycosyltransferase involved in cell wall bisynthesis [Abditibacterium utsteinense]